MTSIPLISVPGSRGPAINVVLHHNSKTTYGNSSYSVFGSKWSLNYDSTLTQESTQFGFSTGNLITVRWGNGKVVPFRYDPNRDLANPITWYPPDGFYDIIRQGGAEGGFVLTTKHGIKYLFSAYTSSNTSFRGGLTKITDRNGKALTIQREALTGRIEKITDANSRSVSFGFNTQNLSYQAKDTAQGGNNMHTFTFDGNGRLWKINYPYIAAHGYVSRVFTYDARSNITGETDLRGKMWECTYNTTDQITSFKEPGVAMVGGYPGYTFDWLPSKSIMKDPYLRPETHNYTSGRIASILDAANYWEGFTFNPQRKVVTYDGKDPGPDIWTYDLDSRGNVLTETSPTGLHSYATYDTDNTMLTTSDDLAGSTFKYQYQNGNLLRTFRQNGNSELNYSQTYYTDGVATSTTIGGVVSKSFSFLYDFWWQLKTITDLRGSVTITPDSMGRYKTIVNQLSKTTTVDYDTWGRPTKVRHPSVAGAIDYVDVAYDPEGNVSSVSDERGKTHGWTYDDRGLGASFTNAKSEVEQYWHSATGFLEKVRNGRGYDRIYKPTLRDEVVQLDMPGGTKERWAFSGPGAVTRYIPGYQIGGAIATQYTYDLERRPTSVTYPSGTENVIFTYPTPSGSTRTSTMQDGSGLTTWTFDALGNLTGLNTPQGNISYGYSDWGERQSMTDATGTTSYDYDNLGRLTKLTNPHSEITEWLYDNAGRMNKRKLSNGTSEELTYDDRNRPTIIKLKNSSSTVLRQQNYGYDKASNVLSHSYLGGTSTTYEYDNINQLTREYRGTSASPTWEQTYSYDANGNRLTRGILGQGSESYTCDEGDRLLTVAGSGSLPSKSFTYDSLGRRKTMAVGGSTTTYNWDAESRITSITKPGVTTNSYTYNALDSRMT
ncbi:MAG: hypothetical protein ABL962_11855, partial [Fimbriimonadaceae bacterium]